MNNNYTIKKIIFLLLFILFITDTSAQIIYTDISDTTVKTISNSTVVFDFDMNNDASNDFSFEIADVSGITGTQVIKYIGANPIRGVVDGPPMGEALNMIVGDTVNSNQSWDPMVSSTGLPLAIYNNGTTMSGLEWSGGIIDGYLGINFMIGTTLVYGWVRIDIPNNSNEITLKDFAYESSGAYIIVGEGGGPWSSIVNNDILDFSISPNPSNGKIQISVTKVGNYTVVVRNLIGQELKKQSFNYLLNKEINISDLKTGIYLISIYSKEYEKTIRVIIQ